jgi:hypothetical protein
MYYEYQPVASINLEEYTFCVIKINGAPKKF